MKEDAKAEMKGHGLAKNAAEHGHLRAIKIAEKAWAQLKGDVQRLENTVLTPSGSKKTEITRRIRRKEHPTISADFMSVNAFPIARVNLAPGAQVTIARDAIGGPQAGTLSETGIGA